MCPAVWPIVLSALVAGYGKETLVLQGLEVRFFSWQKLITYSKTIEKYILDSDLLC